MYVNVFLCLFFVVDHDGFQVVDSAKVRLWRAGSNKAKETKKSTFSKPEHCLQYGIRFP